MGLFTWLALLLAVGVGVVMYTCPHCYTDPAPPVLKDQYFGKGPVPSDPSKYPKDDPSVKKFEIKIPDAVLVDLKDRLAKTRYHEPLDNVQFQYGFNSDYLKELVNYWTTKFDWRKHEKQLNSFSHFTTQIEGLNIHFIRQSPVVKSSTTKVRVIPLLLLHGFPGSIVEFYKILPLLTTPSKDRDFVFEVIAPSIPGFGFSEAPHQTGFGVSDAARVYSKLMDRLGIHEFYVQGGDWGSAIASAMAKVYPDKILGLHINMFTDRLSLCGWAKYLVGQFIPSLFESKEEYDSLYPISKYLSFYIQESGYFHIQATKPDTIGSALTDSPAGLAAYILTLFSTATNREYKELKDGGLTKKFTMDELLTNIMVYWSTNTITSSMRFYKERMSEEERNYSLERVPVYVPTGVAAFPNEVIMFPKCFLKSRLRNIVRYTRMPSGGHFAALEEPQLLADDISNFVVDVESFIKEKEDTTSTVSEETKKNEKKDIKQDTRTVKQETKTAKPETKSAKQEVKPETKTAKQEAKPETKSAKQEAKPETKTAKQEAKPETKTAKQEPKPETKAAKQETKNLKQDPKKTEKENVKTEKKTV